VGVLKMAWFMRHKIPYLGKGDIQQQYDHENNQVSNTLCYGGVFLNLTGEEKNREEARCFIGLDGSWFYGHKAITAYPTIDAGIMVVKYRALEEVSPDQVNHFLKREFTNCDGPERDVGLEMDIFKDQRLVVKPKEMARYHDELREWLEVLNTHYARPHAVMVVMAMKQELRSLPVLALGNRLNYSGQEREKRGEHGANLFPRPTDIPLRDREFAKEYLKECTPENYEVIQAAKAHGIKEVRPVLDELARAKEKFVESWSLDGRLW
jgi:hypothetical protein